MAHATTASTPAEPDLVLDLDVLQRAWRMVRPASWPATYPETMADPLRRRMVEMYARQLLRSDARVARQERSFKASALEHADRRQQARPSLAPGVVDRKRAAAGDRDDD